MTFCMLHKIVFDSPVRISALVPLGEKFASAQWAPPKLDLVRILAQKMRSTIAFGLRWGLLSHDFFFNISPMDLTPLGVRSCERIEAGQCRFRLHLVSHSRFVFLANHRSGIGNNEWR